MKKEKKQKKDTVLTAKQEKFCYEYCIDFNATKAAIRAGYNEKSAYSIGAENLRKPEIQKRIKQMQENLAETAGISSLRVLQEHAKIAFASISNLHNTWIELTDFEKLTEEQRSCIKSISTKTQKKNILTKDGPAVVNVDFVKIELFDKQKSLESISKMLGFDAAQKVDVKGSLNLSGNIHKTEVIFKHYDGRNVERTTEKGE